MSKIDLNSLTDEQKYMLSIWYTYKIDKNENILFIEPEIKTEDFLKYKKDLIEKEFKNSIAILTEWYTQEEIDSWERKIEEAKKVIKWEDSEFLSALLLEWENIKDMAEIILYRANIFAIEYAKIERRKRQKIKDLELL